MLFVKRLLHIPIWTKVQLATGLVAIPGFTLYGGIYNPSHQDLNTGRYDLKKPYWDHVVVSAAGCVCRFIGGTLFAAVSPLLVPVIGLSVVSNEVAKKLATTTTAEHNVAVARHYVVDERHKEV